MRTIRFVLCLCMLAASSIATAQPQQQTPGKQIRITNLQYNTLDAVVLSHGKQYLLKEGKKIVYRLKDNPKPIKGTLQKVGPNYMVVDGRQVPFIELAMIGFSTPRKIGQQVFGGILIVGGTGFLAVAGVGIYLFVVGVNNGDGWAMIGGVMVTVIGLAFALPSLIAGTFIAIIGKKKFDLSPDGRWRLDSINPTPNAGNAGSAP